MRLSFFGVFTWFSLYVEILNFSCLMMIFYVDTEGFVIPSFGIGDPDSSKAEASEVDSTPSSLKVRCIS